MPHQLVDALHTNPDSARWPYFDRLIDLHDAGLIAPEVLPALEAQWSATNTNTVSRYHGCAEAARRNSPKA